MNLGHEYRAGLRWGSYGGSRLWPLMWNTSKKNLSFGDMRHLWSHRTLELGLSLENILSVFSFFILKMTHSMNEWNVGHNGLYQVLEGPKRWWVALLVMLKCVMMEELRSCENYPFLFTNVGWISDCFSVFFSLEHKAIFYSLLFLDRNYYY